MHSCHEPKEKALPRGSGLLFTDQKPRLGELNSLLFGGNRTRPVLPPTTESKCILVGSYCGMTTVK